MIRGGEHRLALGRHLIAYVEPVAIVKGEGDGGLDLVVKAALAHIRMAQGDGVLARNLAGEELKRPV